MLQKGLREHTLMTMELPFGVDAVPFVTEATRTQSGATLRKGKQKTVQ